MGKERVTRRQKDLSRLLRDNKKHQRDKIQKVRRNVKKAQDKT